MDRNLGYAFIVWKSPPADLIDEHCSTFVLPCLSVLLKINPPLQTVKLKHLPAACAMTN